MAIEKISTETKNFYAPRFEIEIEGSKLEADMSKAIIDVSVTEKLNEGLDFTFTVNDEFDRKTQEFKWLDHELFQVGNIVTIKMGYESTLDTMVKGRIIKLEPSFFTDATPTLTVSGQDISFYFMKRPSPIKIYLDKTYSEIAKDLAEKAGLSPEVEDTVKPDICYKLNDQSYFAFLKRLADKVGYELRIDGEKLYFKKPEQDKEAILTLSLGKDIIRFNPEINTANIYSEVIVKSHNPDNPGEPYIGSAKADSERSQEPGKTTASKLMEELCKESEPQVKEITNVIVGSVDEAKKLAGDILSKLSKGLVGGTVECIGIPLIRPGICVEIDKVGKRFSGKYYVTETKHTINSSGYRTSFSVERNAL